MQSPITKLILTTAASVVAAPWLLYGAGQLLVHGQPEKARTVASGQDQLALWSEYKGSGEPVVNPLSPLSLMYGAVSTNEQHASVAVAWSVARHHNVSNIRVGGHLWWHLSGAATTIWLTRNWSIGELLSKEAELRRQSAALYLPEDRI